LAFHIAVLLHSYPLTPGHTPLREVPSPTPSIPLYHVAAWVSRSHQHRADIPHCILQQPPLEHRQSAYTNTGGDIFQSRGDHA